MGTSIIDGTVTVAEVKRARGGITIYKTLAFEHDRGPVQTIKNAVVKQEVADELAPGVKGRFYLYNTFDLKGVHGVRTPEGRAVYAFPANNQKIFLLLGIVNIAWIALTVATRDAVPLLGVAMLVLAIVGYVFMGKGARETKAQYEGDANHEPPAALT